MPAAYVETREVPITELKPYSGNAKLHDREALQESLTRLGQYRSVVARQLPDGTLETLAGHGTIEATDEEALGIVLGDNAIGARAGYDDPALLKLLDQANAHGGLAGTGWDEDEYRDLLKRVGNENPFTETPGTYTTAVNIPQYEPVGPPPPIIEMRDETRADELRARILGAEIPAEVSDYLLAAAGRHVVFNYRKAAEYYPHAAPEVQALMEESALIIIDVDDAIRHGYAKFATTIEALQDEDHTDAPA